MWFVMVEVHLLENIIRPYLDFCCSLHKRLIDLGKMGQILSFIFLLRQKVVAKHVFMSAFDIMIHIELIIEAFVVCVGVICEIFSSS